MAARTVLTTNTLEEFRTTFNSLSSTDIGDPGTLTTTATSVVGAINEVNSAITANDLDFSADSGSNGSVSDAQTFALSGTSNQITTTSDGSQTVTFALASAISGITSFTATGTIQGGTITDGTASLTSGSITGAVNITASGTIQGAIINGTSDVQINGTSVATTNFAIAQAVALG